jgi:F-type H+-transporting ATPase subunit delta
MAELTTIARPYAKAIFQHALEKKSLTQWSKLLAQLALVASDGAIKALLLKPQLTAEQKINVFASVCDCVFDDTAKNFLLQLASNRRLEVLPAVYILFQEFLAEQEKTVDVNVKSAYPLSDEEVKKLTASLRARLGKEVKMESEVDESLIGGIIVHAGDMVIDSSVRGKLAKLTNVLNT